MIEFYKCTECGEKTDNVFVVTGERISEVGILSVERGKFCFECLEIWASRQRRGVSLMKVTTYFHPEIGEIDPRNIHKEKGEICIKPEAWEKLKGD